MTDLPCTALDATSLSVALPVIAADLGGSAIEAFWAGTSFLLTSTVFQPTYASLSHIFGRKPLIFVALTLFAIGAIVAAVAQNFMTLLIGRSIQGVGAGGIISLTEIVVTDMVPLKERGKWFGFLSSMWAIGSVSGPIIGGAFAQKGTIVWLSLSVKRANLCQSHGDGYSGSTCPLSGSDMSWFSSFSIYSIVAPRL